MSPIRYMTDEERNKLYLVWIISYGILFLAVLLLWLQANHNAAEARGKIEAEGEARDLSICRAGNKTRTSLSDFIVGLIDKSDANVEKTVYYQKHPNEAKQVHKQNADAKEEIKGALKAQSCAMVAKGDGNG